MAASTPPRDSEVAASPPRRRRGLALLAGVSALVLLVGGGFLASPWNDIYPIPALQHAARQAAAAVGLALPKPPDQAGGKLAASRPPIVAPSATLADVTPSERPPPPVRQAFVPPPRQAQVQEVLAVAGAPVVPGETAASSAAPRPAVANPPRLDGAPPLPFVVPSPVRPAAVSPAGPANVVPGEPASPTNVMPTAAMVAPLAATTPPPSAPPREAATANGPVVLAGIEPSRPPAAWDLAANAGLAAETTPAAPPAVVAPAPAARPAASRRDPVTAAIELRAAPMTPTEQLAVLELVTQIATMVRESRQLSQQTQGDVARRLHDVEAQLADFRRRLSLAEARATIASVTQAGVGQADVLPVASPPPAGLPAPQGAIPAPFDGRPAPTARPPVQLVRAAAAAPARPEQAVRAAAEPKRYRVQAASPGLAMLAEVDRGGGDGAQLQVVVGNTLDGWGRVRSIGQRGAAWVVTTERGAIQ